MIIFLQSSCTTLVESSLTKLTNVWFCDRLLSNCQRSFFHVKSLGVSALSSLTDMVSSSVGTLQDPFYLQTLAVLSGDASSYNSFLLTPSCSASSKRDCYLWHDFSAENLKYKGIVNLNFCHPSYHLSLSILISFISYNGDILCVHENGGIEKQKAQCFVHVQLFLDL